jgi:transposase-like protein
MSTPTTKSISEQVMEGDGKRTQKPTTEVVAKAKRRRFSAAYKRRIVEEAARCEKGEVAALLRREGLYSSHLSNWRKQYEAGGLEALSAKKRGRKRKDPAVKELEKLRRENERLQAKLEQAELIIEVQKKVSALFGPGTTEGD